ncbi:MAG TPA: O-antigen ligase family protein, partial [Chloroflexota bacterium]
MLTYSRGALIGLLAAVLAMALAGRGLWRPQAVVSWRGPAVILLANLALVFGILALSTSSLEQLRFSTQNDRSWYQASYISTVPPTMTAGRTRTIPVTVENRSPLTWNGSSPHTYGLSYHWLHLSRAVVQFANPITWLSSDLQPGGRQAVHARVQAPVTPGTYLLVWDTVWKGTTWFGPRTGIYPASRVRVIEPALHGGAPLPAGPAPPPDIANLPTSPALDRSQIWSVAVKMIKKHPLFGLGPQGVRMNYMVFTPPDPAAPARAAPPHAHDLALEMLADWGVIGGGLFAVLLAVLWWPLLRRVATGHVEHGWELAVVGAAAALLGHELVDYFLTKQAIFVMLWLLCGLAATMNRNVPGVQAKGPAN